MYVFCYYLTLERSNTFCKNVEYNWKHCIEKIKPFILENSDKQGRNFKQWNVSWTNK